MENRVMANWVRSIGRWCCGLAFVVMVALQPLAAQITYHFPHLAVAGGEWQTTITYINYSPQTVTCETDFISNSGSPLLVSFEGLGTVDSRTDILLPGGSIHEETNVDLSAPLTTGWAQASCSGQIKASLLFRRFEGGVPVAEAGVNATTTPATKFVTFAEQGEGEFGTGVAYANPSSTSALVTFTAKDTAGQTLASVNRTLLPGGHDAQNINSLFGLASFTGSIEVTSTEPIVSLSLNFEADPVFSSLPPGELDASAPTTYYFPHLAVGGEWQTTLTYINVSTQTVTCNTNFFSEAEFSMPDPDSPTIIIVPPLEIPFDGGPAASSRTDELPPAGSIHVESTADLNSPTLQGWAKAECDGPVKASLLFRRRDGGVPVAEGGVNATTALTTKFVTFAEWAGGNLFGTGVALANIILQPVGITVTAFDSAGQQVASTGTALFGQDHTSFNLGPALATAFAENGITSFIGSIHIISTVPIVSLSLNFEAEPVFSSLPPGDLDASTPLVTAAAIPVE